MTTTTTCRHPDSCTINLHKTTHGKQSLKKLFSYGNFYFFSSELWAPTWLLPHRKVVKHRADRKSILAVTSKLYRIDIKRLDKRNANNNQSAERIASSWNRERGWVREKKRNNKTMWVSFCLLSCYKKLALRPEGSQELTCQLEQSADLYKRSKPGMIMYALIFIISSPFLFLVTYVINIHVLDVNITA